MGKEKLVFNYTLGQIFCVDMLGYSSEANDNITVTTVSRRPGLPNFVVPVTMGPRNTEYLGLSYVIGCCHFGVVNQWFGWHSQIDCDIENCEPRYV